MEEVIPSLEALDTSVARFVATLVPATVGATLVTLSGQLGAGKTAFTKAVARVLGVEEVVTSPTFVLEKIYQLAPDKPFKRLIHIDAYRLEAGRDLAPLGFDELMKDEGNLVLLEWPEKVADALPVPLIKIYIEVLADNTRKIVYG